MQQKFFHTTVIIALLSTHFGIVDLAIGAEASTTQNPITSLPPAPQQDTWVTVSKQRPSERWQGFIERALETSPIDARKAVVAIPSLALAPMRTTSQPLRDIARRRNLALPLKNARIVVSKSQRRLDLFDGNQLVKTYHVALGSQPVGHKQWQGDGRTPEGQYFICTRNAQTSAFHIFLGLSYPALPDATRGVRSRAITAREYQVIRQRLASRSAPPWRTRLGGWVGIHGGSGASFAQRTARERGSKDWTAGCIALTNAEIREIYAATKMGTPVLVKP
jgi:lipoprotein-anchoring transpeptidase ErfK/SrfK